MSIKEMVLRLVLSSLFGGLIGFERERNSRPAGFRTNILVSVGSTLIMIVSIKLYYLLPEADVDPGRIAAQVVSGIGFLGAGTIIREGFSVKGLTTAASLWTVAGIGLALGAGFYLSAIVSVSLVILILTLLNKVEKKLSISTNDYFMIIEAFDKPGSLGRIGSVLGENDVNIKNVSVDRNHTNDSIYINLKLEKPRYIKINRLVMLVNEMSGVIGVHIKELDRRRDNDG